MEYAGAAVHADIAAGPAKGWGGGSVRHRLDSEVGSGNRAGSNIVPTAIAAERTSFEFFTLASNRTVPALVSTEAYSGQRLLFSRSVRGDDRCLASEELVVEAHFEDMLVGAHAQSLVAPSKKMTRTAI